MSEYTENAKNTLAGMNVKFSAKFITHDHHFADEKETRDIFRVSFSRNGKKISFRWGQSTADSDGNGKTPPTEYDVITGLQRYDVGTFEDFCGEFGYDTDSRKAEKIYRGVVKEYEKVSSFFTKSEIKKLMEIQ